MILKGYKKFISPLFGARCRFHPSCADYSIQSFEEYGFFKGFFRTVKRVARCNPVFKGGIDPV